MGTRRSRHNKGRKPFYKDHRAVARDLIARPMYPGLGQGQQNGWYNSRTWWQSVDVCKLEILCEADRHPEESADTLGRPPKALAWKARELGLVLPSDWAALIRPKYIRRPRAERTSPLAYPYIIKARPEHADLLAINAIIPAAIPDHMRADMCQEIMIAILEGRTSIDTLRAREGTATYYIKKFYRDNYENGGRAISFQDTDEDWNADAVASSIAAKEWHREQFTERTSHTDSLRTFTPPTQFEAAWQDQIGRHQLSLQELGQFLTREEVEELIDVE